MSLDFQQIHEQVIELGEKAPVREKELRNRREQALELLEEYAQAYDRLREKVDRVVRKDAVLRCALPPDPAVLPPAPLNASFPALALQQNAVILAADGSQIPLDYHAEVEYCVINVGAIQMRLGSLEPPVTKIVSRLLYDNELYTSTGMITDALLAVMRDSFERTMLAELAQIAGQSGEPVITFTDGPVELWGSQGGAEEAKAFQKYLKDYLRALEDMRDNQVTAAGYVDKPASNLVVRLLEVAITPEDELANIRQHHPLRGVTDLYLYSHLLRNPGDRSAVFALQSQSVKAYREDLALHFFYVNVGRAGHSSLARVEIPTWVARDAQKLNLLHAVLVDQCRMMGERPYPYLLHRAHEVATVSFQERDQVTQMIALELRRRGVEVGEQSAKQGNKELSGKTRYGV
jgi:hypothetical protein